MAPFRRRGQVDYDPGPWSGPERRQPAKNGRESRGTLNREFAWTSWRMIPGIPNHHPRARGEAIAVHRGTELDGILESSPLKFDIGSCPPAAGHDPAFQRCKETMAETRFREAA